MVNIIYDPVDKLELIERIKQNILESHKIKSEAVAERMAREWVQKLDSWVQRDAG